MATGTSNTKRELVEILAAGTGISITNSERVIGVLVRYIQERLVCGEKASIAGLGHFSTIFVPEKPGRNPLTGETCLVPPHRRIKFTPSLTLKEKIRKNSGATRTSDDASLDTETV